VKHVLKVYPAEKVDNVLKKILARVMAFSIQKFSSSVIELCLTQTAPA